VLKLLRFLQTRSWDEVALLQVSPATAGQIESVLARYIVYHLERTLRSVTFLDRLRQAMAMMDDGRRTMDGEPQIVEDATPDD